MLQDLTIRAATTEDAVPLLALYRHLSPEDPITDATHARDVIQSIPSYTGSAILIGMLVKEIASSCTLIIVPNLTRGGKPYAVIENVVTRTDLRGQGIGKATLNAATDRAWDYGCYKVMLSTGSQKPSTLAFYESAGFTQNRTGFQKRRLAPRSE